MMDTTGRRKQIIRMSILAFAVLVCAWLLPTSTGIASSATGSMKVTLTVEDTIGVNYGKSAPDSASVNKTVHVDTEYVSGVVNDGTVFTESEVIVTVSSL